MTVIYVIHVTYIKAWAAGVGVVVVVDDDDDAMLMWCNVGDDDDDDDAMLIIMCGVDFDDDHNHYDGIYKGMSSRRRCGKS